MLKSTVLAFKLTFDDILTLFCLKVIIYFISSYFTGLGNILASSVIIAVAIIRLQ